MRVPARGGGAACVDVGRHRPREAPLRRDRPAHPPGRCSSLHRLDERLLGELRPRLIVTQGLCAVCAVSYATVSRAAPRLPADVPVLSLEPATLGDILATAATAGAATGHEREAGRLVVSTRARIDAVGSLPPPAARPRVACLEWTSQAMAAGHWVPELARLAGGDPLGQAGEPSRDAGRDEIVAAAPDLVVLMPCGFDLARTLAVSAEVTRRPGFGQLPAARTGGVVAVDGSSYFNRPGPRILDGLELMAAIVRAKPGDPLPAGAAGFRSPDPATPPPGAVGTDDLPGSRRRTEPAGG